MQAYSEDLRERVIRAVEAGRSAHRRHPPRRSWAAFATITPTDAAGWFAHCGYRT